MLSKKIKWDFWTWVTLIIALVFTLFLIYPLFSLLLSSFKDPVTNEWSMTNFVRFFSRKYYYQGLIHSFKVTTCTTILAVAIGVPVAYFMTSYKVKLKGLVEVLIIISMLSPPFIGAYSWVLLCGRSGVVTEFFRDILGIKLPTIYGFTGILLVFTLKLYPFIYLYVSGALKKIDVSLSEAAESLGCSTVKKVCTIIMPLIMPYQSLFRIYWKVQD